MMTGQRNVVPSTDSAGDCTYHTDSSPNVCTRTTGRPVEDSQTIVSEAFSACPAVSFQVANPSTGWIAGVTLEVGVSVVSDAVAAVLCATGRCDSTLVTDCTVGTGIPAALPGAAEAKPSPHKPPTKRAATAVMPCVANF